MNQDKMINLYRGPSRDAYYQISIHLAARFQRRKFFRNQPIRNKNCLCFLPSFGSFGRAVSEEKILNQPIRNKNCLWRPGLIMGRYEMSNFFQRTFHRCFLPSFGSFGRVVSEEKIFLEINQSETRIACGGHVCEQFGTK